MRSAIILLFVCLIPGSLQAAQLEPITLYSTFRWFEWREQYVEPATGNPASLKEQGPLIGLGASIPVNLLPAPTANGSLVLRSAGELFVGQVRYDGHLQNTDAGTLTPYQTDVLYLGLQGNADLGWRLPPQMLSFEPFAGFGARWWLRNLQGSGGYSEYWLNLSSRFGARATWSLSDNMSLTAAGGAMLPFYTANTADGTTVKPEGKWSGFGEIAITLGHWDHSLFYEGLRFDQSPPEATGRMITIHGTPHPELILQPSSQSDVFGYRLGYRF